MGDQPRVLWLGTFLWVGNKQLVAVKVFFRLPISASDPGFPFKRDTYSLAVHRKRDVLTTIAASMGLTLRLRGYVFSCGVIMFCSQRKPGNGDVMSILRTLIVFSLLCFQQLMAKLPPCG